MVLVSYPERVIQGVNCELGVWVDVSGGNKKAGRYVLARQVLLSLGAAVCSVGTASSCFGTSNAGLRHPAEFAGQHLLAS